MDILVIISYLSLAFMVISTAAYVFFNKKDFVFHFNLLYIIGLMYSRSLTNSAIVTVLMWYFSYYDGDLVVSAVLSNIHDSLSSVLVIFMANLSDSFFGRFRTLLFSNTAYIGGLFLLWMFNPYDVKWLIVIVLVLIALGTSGYNLLDKVHIELVDDIAPSKDREQTEVRAAIWSRMAYVSGIVSAILWVSPSGTAGVSQSWRSIFLICLIAMTTTFIIFLKGYKEYYQEELHQRPAMMFFRVFHDTIGNLCRSDSRRTTTTSRYDPSGLSLESPKRENTRTIQDAEGQDDRNGKYHEQDVVNVKRLLKMFPMWSAYFVVSLISATGSTFFIEQYNNLKSSNKLPFQIYNNLIQETSAFAIPYIFKWVTRYCNNKKNKKDDKNEKHENDEKDGNDKKNEKDEKDKKNEKDKKVEKIKIGAGMLCSVICCIFAWQLEVHRLKAVKILVDQDKETGISFLWLVPQFLMLGCMEGLTREGLLNLFKLQVDNRDLEKYGEEYIDFVLGVGKLFTIALIIIFKNKLGWFSYTINDSRLDKYYKLLVYGCSINFVYYCIIATFLYRKDPKKHEDSANDVQNIA